MKPHLPGADPGNQGPLLWTIKHPQPRRNILWSMRIGALPFTLKRIQGVFHCSIEYGAPSDGPGAIYSLFRPVAGFLQKISGRAEFRRRYGTMASLRPRMGLSLYLSMPAAAASHIIHRGPTSQKERSLSGRRSARPYGWQIIVVNQPHAPLKPDA